MQPNDQQGYFQPDQSQPAQPSAAPKPAPAPPLTPSPQALGQAAVQEAVSEPVAPQAAPVAETYPADDGQYSDVEPIVSWVAHEYIHQEKGKTWFLIFAVIMVALFGLTVFLQQWTVAILIVVIAAVIIVSSKRPPRELTYSLTEEGLVIDDKLHAFSGFKSFGIIRDGEEFSVMLIPVQRFQPGVTVYFPEESGEAIVDILGSRLPMKDLKLDAVDRVVRLLRL